MPSLMPNLKQYLSDQGSLAREWPGYRERPEQMRLAQEIQRGMEQGVSMALEAPTGTGKTLSYLLPALLSARRVILSVGNLTLQDHLWLGEYQKLRALLPECRGLVLLKGCDNYFCHFQYERAREGQLGSAVLGLLHSNWDALTNWLVQTRSGELQSLPLSADQVLALKPAVTLSADQCIGKRCAHFEDCYFQKARQQAADADLLLINHTLLLSDQRLFEKGMGALLPSADAIVVDEAHQLPDLLVRRNTETMEDYALQRWLRRVRRISREQGGLFSGISPLLQRLEQLWQRIRQQLISLTQATQPTAAEPASSGVHSVAPASFKPLYELLMQLQQHLQILHAAALDVTRELDQLGHWILMLQRAQDEAAVLYCDVDQGVLKIVSARVQNPFVSVNSASCAWIFLSATLVVDDSFEYFKRSLSLPELETHRHQQALDYARRALLWVPPELPLPADEAFYPAWIDCLLQLETHIEGGVLALFSSHEALQQCATLLQGRTERNVLVYQSGTNRHRLLQQFRQQQRSLLLATGSFWEGIDVQGSALSCVAIDKLPFAAPDDVLSLAWKFKAGEEGRSVFNDYMVPHAITRLRQGVGRLLRSQSDAGVVMLGDRRILQKQYGGRFRNGLPPMPLTESLQEVVEFLASVQLIGTATESDGDGEQGGAGFLNTPQT